MILIQLEKNLTLNNKELLKNFLLENQGKITEVYTPSQEYWVVEMKNLIDIRTIGNRKEVKDVHYVPDPYPLVSNKWRVEPSVYDLGARA